MLPHVTCCLMWHVASRDTLPQWHAASMTRCLTWHVASMTCCLEADCSVSYHEEYHVYYACNWWLWRQTSFSRSSASRVLNFFCTSLMIRNAVLRLDDGAEISPGSFRVSAAKRSVLTMPNIIDWLPVLSAHKLHRINTKHHKCPITKSSKKRIISWQAQHMVKIHTFL